MVGHQQVGWSQAKDDEEFVLLRSHWHAGHSDENFLLKFPLACSPGTPLLRAAGQAAREAAAEMATAECAVAEEKRLQQGTPRQAAPEPSPRQGKARSRSSARASLGGSLPRNKSRWSSGLAADQSLELRQQAPKNRSGCERRLARQWSRTSFFQFYDCSLEASVSAAATVEAVKYAVAASRQSAPGGPTRFITRAAC